MFCYYWYWLNVTILVINVIGHYYYCRNSHLTVKIATICVLGYTYMRLY